MMTALLVVERRAAATSRVRITARRCAYQGSGVGVLPRGKRVRLETLLYGLLLPSGNDAASALAQHVGGTRRGLRRADERARRASWACAARATRRPTASSTPATTRARSTSPRWPAPCSTSRAWRGSCARRSGDPAAARSRAASVYLYNNNPLLRTGYPGTHRAQDRLHRRRRATASSPPARRHGRRLGVVLLHSPDPGGRRAAARPRLPARRADAPGGGAGFGPAPCPAGHVRLGALPATAAPVASNVGDQRLGPARRLRLPLSRRPTDWPVSQRPIRRHRGSQRHARAGRVPRTVRGLARGARDEAPVAARRGRAEGRGRDRRRAPRVAGQARRGRPGRRHLAEGVRRPGPRARSSR